MPQTILIVNPHPAKHFMTPCPEHPLLMWPPQLRYHPVTPE